MPTVASKPSVQILKRRTAILGILVSLGLGLTCVVETNGQTRRIVKRSGNVTLYPYSPKSAASLNDFPPAILEKLTNHLKNRLGDEFFRKLHFIYGRIVDHEALKRASPTSDFQWKVFTYEMVFEFSMRDVGVKSYEAAVWLDENGDVIREIDLPEIAKDPSKARMIPVKEAIRLGKDNKFRASWVELAYQEPHDSIVWRLRKKDTKGTSYMMDISAHTGKVLNSVAFRGIH